MCGIAGICLSDPRETVPASLMARMTDCLAHRGPDGFGYLMRGNVAFGHRRLSIIDVEGGQQPLYNEDGRIGVVFNGEIYNYVELMAELKARGHEFKTRSDTEVLVHLYEEHGEKCVDFLRGMFAFAIWDGRNGSVLLARDRLGIKPLFYRLDESGLRFASELKALIADPGLACRIEPEALSEYLLHGYVPGDRCILSGVSKLPPAHTLHWQGGRVQLRRYWSPADARRSISRENHLAERVETQLQDALRLHLRSDVPLGVFLSGGVDSSTVVALASAELSGRLKTFSIGFEEADFSELRWAAMTAKRYGTEHHEIVVRDADASVLPDMVWHLDEPFADPSALPTYYVCREAARHVKVCLSGDGADEILAGYTRYQSALKYRYVDWVPLSARAGICTQAVRRMPRAMWGRGLLTRIGTSGPDRYLQSMCVFSPAECAELLDGSGKSERRAARLFEPHFERERDDPVWAMQHADQTNYLPDDICVKVDRMSMRHSLEVRPPFLDHCLVDLLNSCPSSAKLRRGTGKVVLKQIMRDRLPAEVLTRRKTGFGLPIKHWFRGGMDQTARDLLLAPSARIGRFLNTRVVESFLADHARGMRDFSRKIWSLLVLEHWLQRYAL